MKKKVSFFCSSFTIGGVERAFVNLANSFVSQGHEVVFIVCRDIGQLKSELDSRVKVVILGDGRLRKCIFRLYKYIKDNHSDCLITGPTYPNIVALIANTLALKKIKVIVSQHSYQDLEMNNLGFIGRIAPVLIKLTYNWSHKIVAVSDGVRKDMIDNYNVKSKKIVTIHNAVLDQGFFVNSDKKINSSVQNTLKSSSYIVAVGRLVAIKNYIFMLETYAAIKKSNPNFNFNLVILGEGSERDNLEIDIKRLGIQDSVHLLGAYANPLPIIKGAKLFIHSSFSEAMPLVYVEALALKVPVVTIWNKGADYILKGVKTKEIVQNHDQDKFADAILKMLNIQFVDGDFPSLKQYNSNNIMESFLKLI